MITIHHSLLLKNSVAYQYYKNSIKNKLKYFVSIDNSFQGNALLSSLNEDNSGIVWAEESGQIIGCASYHLQKIGKKIFTINFFSTENDEVYRQINDYIEKFAGQQNCYFIEELVTAKDHQRVDYLEKIGYKKEFHLMFKKV